MFGSLILTDKRKYCYGWGWENDEVTLLLTSTLRMNDCYKKLIDNFCDRSATTSGAAAKYLDECDLSQYVTADMYRKTFYDDHVDMTVWRTVVPYSDKYCYGLPLIGTIQSP